ncbi:uncharacterized protein LOC18011270 isoform X2 [Eutrema salsugineum]|uniref:uncharacterized protein LOC18011270 isoform X2 n=1 Tax=Eutrema salsugineum TaxID=72664 RepID=UPI000CED6BA3|nr:uncharacterized protein LOC18011270 isoform X2 [Eutrema salsugineum]
MQESRPYACNASNLTHPPSMPTLLASPPSSLTASTLTSISSPSNNITTLLSKIEKGHDAIKTALEGCKKDLSEAITKALPDAKNSLKTGDYDKAGKSVKLALGFPLSCSDSLQTTKFDFRSFYNRIRIYAQLSNAAMRIIDRF